VKSRNFFTGKHHCKLLEKIKNTRTTAQKTLHRIFKALIADVNTKNGREQELNEFNQNIPKTPQKGNTPAYLYTN